MIALVIFIICSTFISWIDIKRSIIPDRIILPSIVLLAMVKWGEGNLEVTDLIAMAVVVAVFMVPIMFNMNFGGGDLRFGAFCALFLGLSPLGYFIALAGIVHLLIMAVLRKREFGFAPAMSIASLAVYGAVHA